MLVFACVSVCTGLCFLLADMQNKRMTEKRVLHSNEQAHILLFSENFDHDILFN